MCYGQHRCTRIYLMICILFSFYFILISSSFLFTSIKGTRIWFSLTWMFHSSGPYPVTSSTAPTHTSFSVLYRRGFTSERGNRTGSIVIATLSRKQTHSEGQCRQWSGVYYTDRPKAESPLSQGPRPAFVKIFDTPCVRVQTHHPKFLETYKGRVNIITITPSFTC